MSNKSTREVFYTYGNLGEQELPKDARMRVYLPHRDNAWVEIAACEDGGVDVRASSALLVLHSSSNSMRVDLSELYESRADAHKRDLAEQVYDRLAAHGADYNAMCELASELRDDPSNWRQAHPWVKQVYDILARRFSAKAKK